MNQFAYLDAGSGSLIVSALVAGGAGVAVLFRRGWWRFTALFSKQRREQLRETGTAAEPAVETPAAGSSPRR